MSVEGILAAKTKCLKLMAKTDVNVDNVIQLLLDFAKYCENNKDIDNMIEFYLMAIEKGSSVAMHKLGCYYSTKKDYTNMVKYVSMAAEKGNIESMHRLIDYYRYINDDNNMVKYCLMSIKNGSDGAIPCLAHYYRSIKDYENMTKYFLMLPTNIGSLLINNFLHDNFDLKCAYAAIKVLNKVNKHKLNLKLQEYLRLKSVLGDYEDVKPDSCCVCMDTRERIELICKHKICYECYDKMKACPLCRESYF